MAIHRTASALLFAALLSLAVQAPAQRGGGGRGGGGGGAAASRGGGGHQASRSHTQSRGQAHSAQRQRSTHANAGTTHRGGGANATRNANVNRNTNANRNVNRNTNVNRNVNRNTNVNRNVNVNRNWNGNTWGGARVAAGRYAWPRGYAYGRHAVGWVMPGAFLASTYYYSGWASLGLAAPPANYQWVRYGPDLYLVDTLSGQVTDVRYGVFPQ